MELADLLIIQMKELLQKTTNQVPTSAVKLLPKRNEIAIYSAKTRLQSRQAAAAGEICLISNLVFTQANHQ